MPRPSPLPSASRWRADQGRGEHHDHWRPLLAVRASVADAANKDAVLRAFRENRALKVYPSMRQRLQSYAPYGTQVSTIFK